MRARWWFLPLGIYLLSRLVDTLLLLTQAHRQVAMASGGGIFVTAATPADPGYGTLVGNYDGQWYEQIALHGYPSALPPGTVPGGAPVAKTAWPFLPLYPLLVRGVMIVTTLGFGPAASLVSLVASGAAMLVLYRLVLRSGGPAVAALTVLALCVYPSALLLQTAYAEGLALLVVLVGLLGLCRRQYAVVAGAELVLGLTRPIVPALLAVVLAHGIVRWRRGELRRPREWWPWAGAVVAGVAGVLLWPAVAAVVIGSPTAYLHAEEAWDHGAAHYPSWLAHLLGHGPFVLGVLGVLLLAAVVALVAVRRARAWGGELRWWAPLYTLYLLGSTRPNSAMVRMMMLAIVPFQPPPSLDQTTMSRRRLVVTAGAVTVVGLVLQWAWVHWFFLYWRAKPPFGP